MNYTKGEWKHEEDGVITAKDGKQIASVFPRDRLANSNLIAAAPRLFEWIKAKADNGDNDAQCFLATLDI